MSTPPVSDAANASGRAIGRTIGFAASCGEILRRARVRRAELRRLTPAHIVSDQAAGSPGPPPCEWISMAVRGAPQQTLRTRNGCRVIYDVVLPADATIRSLCSASDADSTIDLTIEVSTERSAVSASLRIVAGRTPRWTPLEVAVGARGPARIVLSTNAVDAGASSFAAALWANPRIESPRPVADLWRALRSALSTLGIRRAWQAAAPANAGRTYALRVRTETASRATLRTQREQSRGSARRFTLMTNVAGSAEGLQTTSASVRNQSYPHWEWLLVVPEAGLAAAQRLASDDRRVRVLTVPAGTSTAAAWNAALTQAAGEFAGVLDAGDTLSLDALFEMAAALDAAPGTDLVYSDEDRVSGAHHRSAPRFKPSWSPELLLSENYIGRLTMVRAAAAVAIGGFRDRHAGAEEWDLLLRLSRSTDRIRRVPRCLYHRGGDAVSAGCGAVEDHLSALGRPAAVSVDRGACRAVWPPRGQPLVSIIIPSRNAFEVIRLCVMGLLHGTEYAPKELVIVDNGSTEAAVLELYATLEKNGQARIVPFQGAFNFSAACNAGAAAARGDLLLFLNNDIEIVDPGWLDELVRWTQVPEIGIVGAKLLYPDRTIQHAGVVFGVGLVGHIFSRAAEGTSTPFGSPESYRNYLAVTGACQMMRREVFDQLGGFDERFRLVFSDVVLCMEAWKAGYRVIYTPHARLVHHESYTRQRDDSAQDMVLLARYLEAAHFSEDPFFHPALDPRSPIPAVRPIFEPEARQVVGSYVERVLAAVR